MFPGLYSSKTTFTVILTGLAACFTVFFFLESIENRVLFDIYYHSTNSTLITQQTKARPTSSNNKIKILVTGYGRSSTTFIQQFLGEVLFDKNDTLFLFEALHHASFGYLSSHYNSSSNDYGLILSDFFNCQFFENINFTKLVHHRRTAMINNLRLNDANSVQNKCLSSKYLIYKEIHFHHFESYKLLYDHHPNLKIITMIRNPITHIPSVKRMPLSICSISKFNTVHCDASSVQNWVAQICDNQLHQIQYALSRWNEFQFNVFKMEDMFRNITYKFNQTIKYFYHIFNEYHKLLIDDEMLYQINIKYYKMKMNQWRIGKSKPVKRYNIMEARYIQTHCYSFTKFNQYIF